MTTATQAPSKPDVPREIAPGLSPVDIGFRGIARVAGGIVLAIMLLVGVFLSYRGTQALDVAGWSFLTTQAWEPDAGNFGIAAVLTGTVLIALVAIASPCRSPSAPRSTSPSTRRARLKRDADQPGRPHGRRAERRLRPVGASSCCRARCVGLSPVALHVLRLDPALRGRRRRPDRPAGDRPPSTRPRRSSPGIVVGLMVDADRLLGHARGRSRRRPPASARARSRSAPPGWGMIRAVVLPFGRGGMIGGTMLGLGRALGETIAVFLIISPVFVDPAAHPARTAPTRSPRSSRCGTARRAPFGISALMAAGLALFLLTLVVNFVASIDRRAQPLRREQRGLT